MKQQKIGFTRFIILSLFVIFICLCAAGCNKEDIPKNSGIVIFSTPARYSAEAKATGNLSASPVITPSSAATGTATPTPSPTPAPTPVPTPVPTLEVLPTQGTIIEEFFELPIDFDDPTVTETFNGRTPLKQIRFKVCDPENKQNRSTERVGHWFGKDTPAQPKRFQQHYEEMGWSALTVDMKTTDKILYLTFDCGYENGQTIKILDTLKEKNVPAAFFVTMDYLVSAPDLAARMIAEGHIVGNHSDKHPDFSKISRPRMASELQRVENYLRTHFGYSTRYFRYPMGAYSDNSMDLVTSLGYHSIFWSFAYDDYTEGLIRGKEYAFDKVTKSLHPGEVLLLHAISQDNADALGDIIDYAYAQGYEFRTLKQYFG